MSTPQMNEAIDNCDRFYTVLKSIEAFSEMGYRVSCMVCYRETLKEEWRDRDLGDGATQQREITARVQ